MSISDITRASVKAAIAHGMTSLPDLAERFGVLPMPHGKLAATIRELVAAGEVVEHDNGVLHVNDLYEQLPHDPEVNR